MAIPQKVINFLDKNKVKYDIVEHRTVYTAYDKAATLKVPEKTIGKTIVLSLDKNKAIALIPTNKNLDKKKFKKISKAKKIDFTKELWMKRNLKAMRIGSVPPFGSLWNLPTFIDKGLLQNKKIIVSSGDYNHSLKINSSSFKKIIQDLIVGSFSEVKKKK